MRIHSTRIINACGQPGERFIELPERGLVIVEGKNGSGKSTITADGPAVACWDKTLRPTRGADAKTSIPAWRLNGEAGSVILDATFYDGVRRIIRREKAAGKVSVSWTDGQHFDTATKAQVDLDAIVGDFAVWRRACVFSSSDAVRLSIASMTDGQLKRVVEQMRGLDFDSAAKRCSALLKEQEKAAHAAEIDLASAIADFKAETKSLERAVADLEACKQPAPADIKKGSGLDVEKLEKRRKVVKQGLLLERENETKSINLVSEVNHQAKEAREKLALLKNERCPTCSRPFKVEESRIISAEIQKDLKAYYAELARRENSLRLAREEVADLEETLNDLTDTIARAREANAAAEATSKAAASNIEECSRRADSARQALKDAGAALDVATAVKEVAAACVATHEAAATALGLNGPREALLRRALRSAEGVANAWLERLSLGHMSVSLAGDTMEVEGAGDGYGYAAASEGQKRRIDLALWRGLSELSPIHRNSTIVLDEALDRLDSDGREAVVEALVQLSAERCVVLVTHDDNLAKAVSGKAVKRITVG